MKRDPQKISEEILSKTSKLTEQKEVREEPEFIPKEKIGGIFQTVIRRNSVGKAFDQNASAISKGISKEISE